MTHVRKVAAEYRPFPNLRFKNATQPFEDGSFDIVVDFGTCYHVAGPERALAEISRVLAPGGMFVSETPVSQLIAHPVRSRGRRLPWAAAEPLVCRRRALLWSCRVKPFQPEACPRSRATPTQAAA